MSFIQINPSGVLQMDIAQEVEAYQAQLEIRRIARDQEHDELSQIEEDTEKARAELERAYLESMM